VLDPVINAADRESKFITHPDSITVMPGEFLAPAFPSPALASDPPFSDTDPLIIDLGTTRSTFDITIFNTGGSHTPTGVQLEYQVFLGGIASSVILPPPPPPIEGAVASTLNPDTFSLTVDRALPPGDFGFDPDERVEVGFFFDFGTVNVDFESEPIFVRFTVAEPELELSANELDFGATETVLTVDITNMGQSTVIWNVDELSVPAWLTLDQVGGPLEGPGAAARIRVTADRDALTPGDSSATLTFRGSNGQVIPLDVSVTVP